MKTRWISILSLAKKVLAKYGTLLMKKAMDSPTSHQVEFNYEHLCDLQTLLGLACTLLLLKSIHVFIKFAQM